MKSHCVHIEVIFVALLTICASCGSDENARNFKPVVTEKGSVLGNAISTSIGTAGGSLNSDDGKVALTVPVGALTSNTTISIQPINNEGPLGLGLGYRLLPEGTTFQQPVTLTFHYDDDLSENGEEDFLWIITQAEDGSWNALLKSELNTSTKTVTVTTMHFSDWALGKFIDLKLEPASKTVSKGQSVDLKLSGFSRDQPQTEDDLAPLVPINPDVDVLEPLTPIRPNEEQLLDFRITGWSLNGVAAPVSNNNGSLNASKREATYKAPDARPSVNPVAVSVHLEAQRNGSSQKTQYTVTSSISVVTADLLVVVDGQVHEYFQYGFNGSIPSDPNDVRIANCGTNGDGGLVIAGTYIQNGTNLVSGFAIEMASPPASGTVNLKCINNEGKDDASFQLGEGQKYYSLDYAKRTPVNQNCDENYLCGNVSVTFRTYEDETMGNVRGSFSGTLYEPAPEGSCQSDIPHTIEGEFSLTRAD